jgi:hypothetical protein
MKKSIRIAFFTCAIVTSLAFASSAFASFAPKLIVSSATAQGGAARVGVVVSNADDPTAKVSIYVPNGYQLGSSATSPRRRPQPISAAPCCR